MRVAYPAISLLALTFAGCGYVGPVQPPSADIPAQISDLAAVERGKQLVISFHTPARTIDGAAVTRFADIDLKVGVAPTPFDFESWAQAAKSVPVALPAPGDRFDPLQIAMRETLSVDEWVGKRIAVAVRTATKHSENHYSQWSNRVILEVVAPLAQPMSVKVDQQPEGVVLDWDAVEGATGYRILRQSGADRAPVEAGTTETAHFVDQSAQFDNSYQYSLVATNGTAESEALVLKGVERVDVFPPAAPSGLTVLAGPQSLELSWQRNTEAKVQGYYVYRATEGGDFARLGELAPLPSFSDKTVEHGKTYRYRVTAIDKKNNESKASDEVKAEF